MGIVYKSEDIFYLEESDNKMYETKAHCSNLDYLIERIEQYTKELEAITYLEHRSYNSFDYFKTDIKLNLAERKNELYKMIFYTTQELKERI